MSALRNAVQRRNHKERSQPHERRKWGLLEKHKDYSLRAQDHKVKKRKIKALQTKASQRNEDEFYFGMMNSQTRDGIRIAKRGQENSGGLEGAGKALSIDVVKLMKTQDAAYLRTVLQSTRKARERLDQDMKVFEFGVPTDIGQRDGKVLFDDNGDPIHRLEKIERENDVDESDDDEEEEMSISLDDMVEKLDDFDDSLEKAPGLNTEERRTSKKQRRLIVLKKTLDALTERERTLAAALREVEEQQARMNGNAAGGVNKHGIRFKSKQRRR